MSEWVNVGWVNDRADIQKPETYPRNLINLHKFDYSPAGLTAMALLASSPISSP